MLIEMFFFLSILLLQNKIEAFVLVCLAFVLMGVVRRFSSEEELPFIKGVSRDFGRARAVFGRAQLASVVIFGSGCLFVAGVLDSWVLTIVTSLAVWGVWKKWKATRSTQQSDSAPPDSSRKPALPAGKEGTFERSTSSLMRTAEQTAAKPR